MDLSTLQRVTMGITLALSLITVSFSVFRLWKLNFRLSTASDAYCSQYMLPFSFLAGMQINIAITSQVTFAILSWSSSTRWTLLFTGSVVLSSISKESIWAVGSAQRGRPNFNPRLLGVILASAIPLFITGIILVETVQPWDKVMVGASVLIFRSWMIGEWIQINMMAVTNKLVIQTNLAIHVLAVLASAACMIPRPLLSALSEQAIPDKLSNPSEYVEGYQETAEPDTPTSVASSTRYRGLPTWPTIINEHECPQIRPLQNFEQEFDDDGLQKHERDADELAMWIQELRIMGNCDATAADPAGLHEFVNGHSEMGYTTAYDDRNE
ncbi:hypothetical protein PG988_015107 [Apiospora saccharicola]